MYVNNGESRLLRFCPSALSILVAVVTSVVFLQTAVIRGELL